MTAGEFAGRSTGRGTEFGVELVVTTGAGALVQDFPHDSNAVMQSAARTTPAMRVAVRERV